MAITLSRAQLEALVAFAAKFASYPVELSDAGDGRVLVRVLDPHGQPRDRRIGSQPKQREHMSEGVMRWLIILIAVIVVVGLAMIVFGLGSDTESANAAGRWFT
jgi:hypothetical protein